MKRNKKTTRARSVKPLTWHTKVQILRNACGVALGLRGRYCEIGGYEVSVLLKALKDTKP